MVGVEDLVGVVGPGLVLPLAPVPERSKDLDQHKFTIIGVYSAAFAPSGTVRHPLDNKNHRCCTSVGTCF